MATSRYLVISGYVTPKGRVIFTTEEHGSQYRARRARAENLKDGGFDFSTTVRLGRRGRQPKEPPADIPGQYRFDIYETPGIPEGSLVMKSGESAVVVNGCG